MSERPLVVEVVGVAGAGKTTLVRTLTARDPSLAAGIPLSRALHLYHLVLSRIRLLPVVVRPSKEDVRAMVYLEGWSRLVDQAGLSGPPAVLLDHGPLFRLVRLREFGIGTVGGPRFDLWWKRMRDRWAGLLDLVVWLDAPDDELRHRILARNHVHKVQSLVEGDALELLRRYRAAYEDVISGLGLAGGTTVIRFDTTRSSPDRIASEVSDWIHRRSSASDQTPAA